MNVKKVTGIVAAVVFAVFVCGVFFASCTQNGAPGGERALKMATTTSTENSGLLDELLPVFEEEHNARVDVIAVGTGKALKLGENGDVDILMVHAPDAEKAFVDAGHGVNRTEIMYNDFIILGPPEDPAGVKGMKNAAVALARIAEKEQEFISRGDDSGTHKKEKKLWASSGVAPAGEWYKEIGRGMGATITMAGEKQAYTLADRGTYLSMKKNITIVPLVEGDPALHNLYSVIAISREKYPHVEYDLAMEFIDWISSAGAKEIISQYKVEGEVLFHPLD